MARDKTLIVGNWKMNLNMGEASLYVHQLSKMVKPHRDVEVILAPTSLVLQSLSLQINPRQFKLAAQNFYWRDQGAYTGEISASQLRGVVQYALVGHSERRHVFHESDKDTRAKVQAAIRNRIKPILCIGETAFERSEGETNDVLHDQLIGGLANITSEELEQVAIAYEPVWAIGSGQNAVPADVTAAARAIRSQIKHLYGEKAANNIAILYGGSVKEDSAADYLALDEIDGLLVGGASLDAHVFNEIIKKAHKPASAGKE
ncbi:triose-phosphate isomerase [Patescibacteria group bacterium]|nr:MAG: triose-phosphate isomerase [Patescibacteria group bacterium]